MFLCPNSNAFSSRIHKFIQLFRIKNLLNNNIENLISNKICLAFDNNILQRLRIQPKSMHKSILPYFNKKNFNNYISDEGF